MEVENNKPYLRRWWIVGSILVGTWVGTLGSSMIPVALPSILKHFNTPLNTGIWLISIYTLMVAVFMPVFGWLGNRYGYRRVYSFGLAGFAIFSFLAAIAPNIESLICFRVLQGIFNATTPPCVMGIISKTFPTNERGSAMGAWATVNGGAHGLGPVISGSMIIFFGWSSIFLFMGTCTLIGMFLIFYFVPPDYDKDPYPFDWIGAGTFTLAILIFMFSLTQFGRAGWALWNNFSLLGASLFLFIIFLVTESKISNPFINLKLFINKAYSAAVAVTGVQFFCLLGLQILIPLYLINLRGYSEMAAGLTIAVMSSTLAIFSPFSGWIADKKGSDMTIRCGLIMITATIFSMIFWNSYMSITSIFITLIFVGLGMGFTQSPAAATVTVVVPKNQLGVALGIYNMQRMISATLGATVCGFILSLPRFDISSEFSAFRLTFIILSCAVAATFLLIIIVQPFKKQSFKDEIISVR